MSNNDSRNINVTSYGQSGGITAGQVFFEKRNRSLVGRTVQADMARILKGRSVEPVQVDAVNADGEAQQFTQELWRVISGDFGWQTTSMPNTVMTPGVLVGLRIRSVADASDREDPLRALAEWLGSLGMRVEYSADAKKNQILVGVQG